MGLNNFWAQIISGPKKFWGQKNLIQKDFLFRKSCVIFFPFYLSYLTFTFKLTWSIMTGLDQPRLDFTFPNMSYLSSRVSHFSKIFEFYLPNPGSHSILYLKEESKFSEFSDFVYYSKISRQNGSDPCISEKKKLCGL